VDHAHDRVALRNAIGIDDTQTDPIELRE